MDLRQERVLVTGGTGFLGRHLVTVLRERGVSVIATGRHPFDLCRLTAASAMISSTQATVVFHLAATVGGIGANAANPGLFFYDNMQMGLNVVEASRIAHIKKLVMVGTCCSYPKAPPVPFKEESLWDGYPEATNAPYGIAKRALLEMARAYRVEYGLDIVSLVPANLYGPGDHFDPERSHVIPGLVRKCVDAIRTRAAAVTCWGTGIATREFLHVRDCAAGLIAACEAPGFDGPVNLGTGTEISIRDLAHLVAEMSGYRGPILWDATRPDGQPRRALDISRAKMLFGWRAQIPLVDGLAETIRHYEKEIRPVPAL